MRSKIYPPVIIINVTKIVEIQAATKNTPSKYQCSFEGVRVVVYNCEWQ